MGEGLFSGGVFRKAAPGTLEINIPGIAESSTNKIIRNAYFGKQKGASRSQDAFGRLYPLGFTPPVDYYVDPTNLDQTTGYPVEMGDLPITSVGGSVAFKNSKVGIDPKLEKTQFSGVDILIKTSKLSPIYSAGYLKLAGGADQDLNPLTEGFYTVNPEDPTKSIPKKPKLLGNFPVIKDKTKVKLRDRYSRLKNTPFLFFDAQTVQFRHLVEYYESGKPNSDTLSSVFQTNAGRKPGEDFGFRDKGGGFLNDTVVSSFVRTHDNNEDPTILGFDVYIRLSNSPLFNGTIEHFIEKESSDNFEIQKRLDMLKEFKKQFLGFFKMYKSNYINENLPDTGAVRGATGGSGDFNRGTVNLYTREGTDQYSVRIPNGNKETFTGVAAKSYYIKSISGLDKLNEQYNWGSEGGTSQTMVNYGTDFLKLTMNEDVSQNMGYLSSLYKNLTWSRERGRLAFPENLLRFELVIDVTEIRKYARVFQESASDSLKWKEVADLTSKYRYFVHDCQLFFPKQPHGDMIDNTTTGGDKSTTLDMNVFFKHSNLRFMKFQSPLMVGQDWSIKVIDNTSAYDNSENAKSRLVYYVDSFESNKIPYLDKFDLYQDLQKGNTSSTLRQPSTPSPDSAQAIAERNALSRQSTFEEKFKAGLNKIFDQTSAKLKNAAQNFINNQLLAGAALLNRALNEIYNSLPIVGGIPPPKNVYTNPNEWEQAYIDFIGPGLKGFFQDPTKFRQEGKPGETLRERIDRGTVLQSSDIESGNSAFPDQNKTLKEIVDANPQLGNGFSGTSQIPFIGNSAEQSQNKTLKQIVDSDPDIGNSFSGISKIPFIGNKAVQGPNKTLKQVVDGNPSLGLPGSQIPIISSVGNNADTGPNFTLNQLVEQSPDLGNPGSNIPTIPSVGNNADSGPNLPLQTIVDKDPNLGIPGTKITTTSFIGNNALPGTNKTLQEIVDSDPSLGIGLGIIAQPSVGNNAQPGTNKTLQEIVDSDPSLGIGDVISTIPSIGNNAQQGSNSTLQQIVDSDPDLGVGDIISSIPSVGNNAQFGTNITNNEVVGGNSNVINPFIGNSGLVGQNESLSGVVDGYSINENPEISNQGLPSKNLSLETYTKYSGSKVFGTVDWGLIQFPNSAQKFPPPIT
jgi:hypothetical protein